MTNNYQYPEGIYDIYTEDGEFVETVETMDIERVAAYIENATWVLVESFEEADFDSQAEWQAAVSMGFSFS